MPLEEDAEKAWLEWLSDAHDIVAQWEDQIGHRLLTRQAAALAEAIARALHDSFERGRLRTRSE